MNKTMEEAAKYYGKQINIWKEYQVLEMHLGTFDSVRKILRKGC